MINNIIFFDTKDDFINEIKRLHTTNVAQIKYIKSDVQNLINNNQFNINTLISPANCFGFMDGGIDAIYMKLFPNIQNTVQNKIKTFNLLTSLDRHYIPIGSAITVKTNNPSCPFLISAPTMFFPSNINNTNNIYFSFLAILYISYSNPNLIIGCPGLGTGIGKLSPKNVVDQIEQAINDFYTINNDPHYIQNIAYKDKFNFVLKKIPCKQPDNYANYEIPK